MSEHQRAAPPRLELRGITKRFPGVVANSDVSFSVAPGEIHALLGENGAGKSTLVKIIYGVLHADEGEMLWDGRPVEVADPKAARALGRRHGVPAFFAVRGDDGARERGAGRRRRHRYEGAGDPGSRGQPRLRPAAGAGARGPHAFCRRAPADRDRPLPAAEPAPADHGRADLGADPAGGRQAVRDPAPARGRRRLDPLHQPQAARDQSLVRPRHHPARRQGGGCMRPQGRDRARHGATDDRRGAADAEQAGRRPRRARSGSPWSISTWPRRRRTASISSGSGSRSAPARSWASPGSPATARTS